MILIKKYPHRRLYDTSQSRYVNMDYIASLVKDYKDFQVVDSKSGEDLTKSILLQIISDQETSEERALLTTNLLKQLIRYYGNDMQLFVAPYLEHSLANFLQQQDALQGMVKSMAEANPVSLFGKIVEQNLEAWKSLSQRGDKDKE